MNKEKLKSRITGNAKELSNLPTKPYADRPTKEAKSHSTSIIKAGW